MEMKLQGGQAGTGDGGLQAGLPLQQGAPKRDGGKWRGKEVLRGKLRGRGRGKLELGVEPPI